MSELTDLWKSAFGDAYVDRNAASDREIAKRIPMWRRVLAHVSLEEAPRSFLDVGAGCGANICALALIYAKMGMAADFYAVEPNAKAREAMRERFSFKDGHLLDADASKIPLPDGVADMCFTCGVLIHIAEPDLHRVMSEIHRCSARYVFAAEYFSPVPQAITYRGAHDALFKRDYGSIWVDQFPLRVLAYGFEWKRFSGLDDVTWWLMEKTN